MSVELFNFYVSHMNGNLKFISGFDKVLADRERYIHSIQPNLNNFSFILVLVDIA